MSTFSTPGFLAHEELKRLIWKHRPLVDCHRHLASEGTLTAKDYATISDDRHLKEKWLLMDRIRRRRFYLDELPMRLDAAMMRMMDQGIFFCRTYAEVDSVVGLHVIEAMLEAKERWAGFTLQIAAYPFGGVGHAVKRKRAERALEMADLLGCLPSRGRKSVRDRETSRRNMEILFAIAHEQQKPIDLQIDQDNDPDENETWILLDVAEGFREKGYKESITVTHCISLSASRTMEMDLELNLLPRMRKLGVSVVVCPSAALDMRQPRHKQAPTHNSIAPVSELLLGGITVGIGSDNVSDIYESHTTGDLREEMGKMLSAIRWTGSLETIAKIMTTNGRKILGV